MGTRKRLQVEQYDADGNYIQTFNSVMDCARYFGVSKQYIAAGCVGYIKSVKGYKLRYVRTYTEQDETTGEVFRPVPGMRDFVHENIDAIGDPLSAEERDRLAAIKRRKLSEAV